MSRRGRRQRELGAFLRERRSRLTPAAVGLIEGPPRRTPGLRREDVANLAGISVGYYTRLEQGHAGHPSDSVLDALIRTLRLTADEARHVKALARTPPDIPARPVSRTAPGRPVGSGSRASAGSSGAGVGSGRAAMDRPGHMSSTLTVDPSVDMPGQAGSAVTAGLSVDLPGQAGSTVTADPSVEQASPSALRMISLLAPPTAAVVLGRTGDVLAWNEAASLLFPGRLADHSTTGGPASLRPDSGPGSVPGSGGQRAVRPNNARYVFCDPRARELFADWDAVADETVAQLRSAAGHLVDDPAYRALVDELSAASPEFAERWQRREVRRHVSGEKRFNHPTLGRLTVDYDVVAVLDEPDQYLVVYGLRNSQLGDVEIKAAVSTSL